MEEVVWVCREGAQWLKWIDRVIRNHLGGSCGQSQIMEWWIHYWSHNWWRYCRVFWSCLWDWGHSQIIQEFATLPRGQQYQISNIVQYPPPQPINIEVAKPLSAPSGCTKLAFFGLIPLSFPQLALHSNKQWINALINMMFIYGISAKNFHPILDETPPPRPRRRQKIQYGILYPPTAQKHTPPYNFYFTPPPRTPPRPCMDRIPAFCFLTFPCLIYLYQF